MEKFRNRAHYVDSIRNRLFTEQTFFESAPKSVSAAFRATLNLLLTGGLAELSMRRIADQAGISLGTLTYHFPSKAKLISQCLDRFVDEEIGRILTLAEEVEDPLLALEIGIRTQIEITLHPLARRFDFEYWAYAEHETSARSHLEDILRQMRENTADLICAAYPEKPRELAMRQATLMEILIEGMPIMMPADDARISELGLETLYEDTVQACLSLAHATDLDPG